MIIATVWGLIPTEVTVVTPPQQTPLPATSTAPGEDTGSTTLDKAKRRHAQKRRNQAKRKMLEVSARLIGWAAQETYHLPGPNTLRKSSNWLVSRSNVQSS